MAKIKLHNDTSGKAYEAESGNRFEALKDLIDGLLPGASVNVTGATGTFTRAMATWAYVCEDTVTLRVQLEAFPNGDVAISFVLYPHVYEGSTLRDAVWSKGARAYDPTASRIINPSPEETSNYVKSAVKGSKMLADTLKFLRGI